MLEFEAYQVSNAVEKTLMTDHKPNKHDRYVEQLVRQIQDDYDSISTYMTLERRKRLVGEIDVVARKGNELHIYEVKCSYRITKARKQLAKIKRIFGDTAMCYFYCGSGNQIIQVC